MNAISTPPTATPRRQTRHVIVRANAPLFYSIAIASLLETHAAQHPERLLECLGVDSHLGDWIRNEWLPRKEKRAAALRQYVADYWPEFDWAAASDHYRSLLAQEASPALHRATGGFEALVRCANAAQAGVYYRALAKWSDDHALRTLARGMAEEEADASTRFGATFERRGRREQIGLLRAWRTVRACVRASRDMRVRLAFDALNAQCSFNSPFPVLAYPEFIARMRAVIERCAQPRWSERLLFKAWARVPALAVESTRQPALAGFKPVLAPTA